MPHQPERMNISIASKIRIGKRRGASEPIARQHQALVQEGVAAIQRGEYTDYNEEELKGFFAGVVDRGKKRLAAERKRANKPAK